MDISELLNKLGVPAAAARGGARVVHSPIDGSELARVCDTPLEQARAAIARAHQAFLAWRELPAPKRGELVRLFGEELRANKEALGRLVTIENGKILQEGLGEVQEMIDICDFAVGLSRQLHGLTIASERPGHRMMETWHPLGVCGVISAFNFPVAVWAWNAALALVCGDAVVWKPSEKTPLCALAANALLQRAAQRFGSVPEGLSQVLIGGAELGELLADDARIALLSATGSTRMGRAVAPRVANRLGRTILELGGNNAAIVCPSADLRLVERGVVFAAAGTAGQRCTTLRRLIVHDSIYDTLVPRLAELYARCRVGNPLESETLVGPLIDARAFEGMQAALAEARAEGARVHGGARVEVTGCEGGYYVRPAIAEVRDQSALVRRETFAPILYVMRCPELSDAMALHNAVPQGLASSIFTNDMREAESFVSSAGSDCGIANVNIGPSGAEIGGAFGGEKETGGGRESGSDAWKAYMRRATNTINYSRELPLSQGIRFDLEE
jgi:L-aminoadipate-semialdehyde dehydrogenase